LGNFTFIKKYKTSRYSTLFYSSSTASTLLKCNPQLHSAGKMTKCWVNPNPASLMVSEQVLKKTSSSLTFPDSKNSCSSFIKNKFAENKNALFDKHLHWMDQVSLSSHSLDWNLISLRQNLEHVGHTETDI